MTVVNGACVEESVIAQVALQDYGNRLLLRVGGPGNLTACQPRWALEISRAAGDCFTTDPGYGTCCDLTCQHGRRLTQTCFCYCDPGFTGAACDRMLPYIQVDLLLGNTTLGDWLAFSRSETRSVQAANRLAVRSALSDALAVEIFFVEFLWARQYAGARRAGPDDGPSPAAAGPDSYSLADAAEDAAEDADPSDGSGLDEPLGSEIGGPPGRRAVFCSLANYRGRTTVVSVRVIQKMEHNLFYLRRALAAAQPNLTSHLAAHGAYFCLFGMSLTGYSSYGTVINATEAALEPITGLSRDTVLLIVFTVIGGLIVLAFVALYFFADYAEGRDKTRFLRDYNPVRPGHKQGGAWRHEDPATRLLVAYPGDVSARLQRAFVEDWMEQGRPTLAFTHEGKEYEADFRDMAVSEAPPEGVIVEVQDRRAPAPAPRAPPSPPPPTGPPPRLPLLRPSVPNACRGPAPAAGGSPAP